MSIMRDTPMQVVSWVGLTHPKYRCVACAEGVFDPGQLTAPDLPRLRGGSAPLPFAAVADLARDFKMAQAGDRDPGEDDA
jgi:hypothetical protein